MRKWKRAMDVVLGHLGLDHRRHLPPVSQAAAKKRRQHQGRLMAPIVAAERAALEAEVAAGRMVKVSDYAYVNSG
jgi:hypothetical protein